MDHREGEFQLKFQPNRSSRFGGDQKCIKSHQDGFRPPGDNLLPSKSKDFSVYSHSLALPGATMFRPSVETEKSLDFTAFLAILGDPDSFGLTAKRNGQKI